MINQYNEELLKNFKHLYKNFINSITKKDYGFFERKCEKNLYLNLKKNLDEESEKMYINDLKVELLQINIEKINLQLNIGASTDREFNKKLVKAQEQNNMFENIKKQNPSILIEFDFYKLNQKENPNNVPLNLNNNLLRFFVDIKTNYIISRTPIKDDKQFENHSIIFEWETNTIFSVFKILKENPLLKMNPIVAGMMKNKTEDFNIIISDFDKYLNGNKFI